MTHTYLQGIFLYIFFLYISRNMDITSSTESLLYVISTPSIIHRLLYILIKYTFIHLLEFWKL